MTACQPSFPGFPVAPIVPLALRLPVPLLPERRQQSGRSRSSSEFTNRTKNVNNIQRASSGEVSINFGYRGSVIPLRVFDTKVDRSGRVVTRVKKSSARQALDHAFEAKMGSHYGIYERQGEKRFPVKELFGPATPQMMYSNEVVMDSIEAKMASTYEERIEHEITRVLNGWGV